MKKQLVISPIDYFTILINNPKLRFDDLIIQKDFFSQSGLLNNFEIQKFSIFLNEVYNYYLINNTGMLKEFNVQNLNQIKNNSINLEYCFRKWILINTYEKGDQNC